MYIVIVGGGKVGFYLAKELVEANHEVLVIERNASKCAEIQEALGEIVMRGDGCEAAIQERAGVNRADLILAVTGEDEDNLVACQVAKHLFGVPRSLCRIYDPIREQMYHKLGLRTISPTKVGARLVKEALEAPGGEPVGTHDGGRAEGTAS